MPLRKPSTILTLLVLLMQAAFAVFGTGLALCQESDGQVSIEWSGADCCSAQPTNASRVPPPQFSEQGECGGCKDSVFDQPQKAETPNSSLRPLFSSSAGLPELPSRLPDFRRAEAELPVRGGLQLHFLRTIVIRC